MGDGGTKGAAALAGCWSVLNTQGVVRNCKAGRESARRGQKAPVNGVDRGQANAFYMSRIHENDDNYELGLWSRIP